MVAAVLAFVAFCANAKEFNVGDYGAVGNGTTLCTASIQKAIDAAATAGGGTVMFPKGKFLTGALFIKSGVEFRVDEGVELDAITNDADYPQKPTRIAGIEITWPSALLNVYEQKNVKITGKGIIDGHGEFWWRKFWGEDGHSGMLGDYTKRGLRWATDYDCQRIRTLVVYKSKNVAVRDLTLKRSGFWTVQICYSDRVKVDGLKIRANANSASEGKAGEVSEGGVTIRGNIANYGPSSDGVDIDSSKNVEVSHCDIDCNDDDICLKAGRDADGLRVNRPTENISIHDCITRAGHGMLTIGSETSGGIRNVDVYNIKAIGTSNGIRFKSARIRGGVIKNIRFHDIEMDNVPDPIFCELNWYPSYSYAVIPTNISPDKIPAYWKVLATPVPPQKGIPEFRDIDIKNLKVTGADEAIYVNAFAEKPLRNVCMENVSIEAKTAGVITNAVDWKLKNVVFKIADRKNVTLHNSPDVPLPKLD